MFNKRLSSLQVDRSKHQFTVRLLTQIKCGSFSIVDQLIIEYSMKVFINDFHALSQRLMTVDEAATVRGHEFIVEGMTIHHMHRCN